MWIKQSELGDLRIGDCIQEIDRSNYVHVLFTQVWEVVEIKVGCLSCVKLGENPACVERLHEIKMSNVGNIIFKEFISI